jgi:hypothetical protein
MSWFGRFFDWVDNTQKVERLPEEVEAIQYTGENSEEVSSWMFPRSSSGLFDYLIEFNAGVDRRRMKVTTMKSVIEVSPGDWVIRRGGGHVVVSDSDFHVQYVTKSNT